MPYVNGVMKGSEKENASMGYLKFRKNKRNEKNSDTEPIIKKEDLDNLFIIIMKMPPI